MSVSKWENQSPKVSFERERGVYAVQVTRDVAHAVVPVGDDSLRSSRILQVFRALADASVPIFLIKMHRTAVTFAMAGEHLALAEAALTRAGLSSKTRRDLAVVSVRAASMRDLSGVMVQIADAFNAAGARLYETGDSHNSVQSLIAADHIADAVRELCQTFRLDSSAVEERRFSGEDPA